MASNAWLAEVGFVPLLDSELLSVRHALLDKVAVLRGAGYHQQAAGLADLFAKLGGLQGSDYKIVPLTAADRDAACGGWDDPAVVA